MAFWNKPIKKWQPKDWFIPAALYDAVMPDKPKIPEYKPSAWETEGYDWLKGIREGSSPLLNTENSYQLLKEQMQPEYERMQKEYDIFSAQRGIQGGPQQAFRHGIAEDQVKRLMQARRQLEEMKQKLQMAAGQSMTQLGSARSAAESQQAMAQFQAAYQQYQQMQQALGDLMGAGLSYAVGSPVPLTVPQNNSYQNYQNSIIGREVSPYGYFPNFG